MIDRVHAKGNRCFCLTGEKKLIFLLIGVEVMALIHHQRVTNSLINLFAGMGLNFLDCCPRESGKENLITRDLS